MRNNFKKILSVLLVAIMVLTSAPASGFVELEFTGLNNIFVKAQAASTYTEGYFTYYIYNNMAFLTSCDVSASGSIIIPDTINGYPVAEINSNAFKGCEEITSITIPNSVKKIAEQAFAGCEKLETVKMADSVEYIGRYAFWNCTSLKNINISKSMMNIEEGLFAVCSSLEFIDIPANISIINDAFYDCTNLKRINVDSENEYYYSDDGVLIYKKYKRIQKCPEGKTGEYVIPDGIELIGEGAFSNCSKLTNIIIPSSVTEIYDYAFSSCSGLTAITLPNSVTSIGVGSFYGCSGLNNIALSNKITGFPIDAFINCISLKEIDIPLSVTTIGSSAFKNCSSLTEITIPNSVEHIYNEAFSGCKSLTSVKLSDNITNIAEETFYECTSLKSIEIPYGVEEIGARAFAYCNSLGDVTIPNSVKGIGKTAFGCCKSLKSVNIPDSVTSMGEEAFAFCYSLKDVKLGSGLTKISDNAFRECTELTSITVPKNITDIGEMAFATCYNLKTVVLQEGLSSIRYGAFGACCSLESIVIPDSVTVLESGAFSMCTKLKSAKLPNNITTCASDLFSYCMSLETVELPNTLETVGENSFALCISLKELELPLSVVSIGKEAFLFSGGINELILNENVDFVGEDAFWLADNTLQSVKIYSENAELSTRSIGYYNKPLSDYLKSNKSETFVDLWTEYIQLTTKYEHVLTAQEEKRVREIESEIGFLFNNGDDATAFFDESFTVYGYSHSTAYTYANENGIKFVPFGEEVCDHNYEHEEVLSTCQKQGYKKDVCSKCGDEINFIELPFANHDFDEWKTTKVATCTETGVETRTCGVCKTEETRELKATGHDIEHITISSTCTVAGVEYDYCYECEQTLNYKTLPLAAHSFGEWETTKEATCTEDGIETRTCSVCKTDETKTVKASGHNYKHEEVLSTCQKQGYKKDVCSRCADTINSATFPLAAHSFGEWKTTKEATCTEDGIETRTCSVCKTDETKTVKASGHNYKHEEVLSTCQKQGYKKDVCSRCADTINSTTFPLAAHSFGEWQTTKEATIFNSGEKVGKCKACGFVQAVSIEKLPSTESKDEKSGISVICPDGSYESEIEVEVSQVFDGESYQIINSEKGNRLYCLFDISTFIDGQKIQPNTPVWVKIPLPDKYNPDKSYVYYITNTGTLERMNSFVQDGYIYFEATHFSFYAIVDEGSTVSSDVSTNCSCNCHKTGFFGFIWKILKFFYKLFGTHKVCECGKVHY